VGSVCDFFPCIFERLRDVSVLVEFLQNPKHSVVR
jgi:hypothetical protein